MAEDRIPLARPDLGEREEQLALEALRSGRLSLGPMVERFERGLAERLGVDDVVAVANGTAALHLGVRALGWGPGDEVVTSPLSFVASANCLLFEGATPVFCDVDPATLNLDPGAAAAAIGERTAGLLPVHIFGYPAAVEELGALAERHRLGLLEDACESLGAIDAAGRPVGSAGNLTTLAFYANKQLTTGEGGAIVPRDAADATRFRSERNQGRAPDMAWLSHERLGYNYRLPEVSAAIGVAQLERAEAIFAARARVAQLYRERLAAVEGLGLPCPDRGAERRSWFVYVVQLPERADRDATVAALAERGIEAKEYLPCIHLYPHYRERFGFAGGEFPVAESISARSIALPFYSTMQEAEVERVCDALLLTLRDHVAIS